jgi:preprotein translocase subunit SecG
MPRQKSQQRSSFSESGKILGLKWYWWIFIIVIIFILLMAITGIGKGSGGIAGNLSRAFLGFADGILNILGKSSIFWFFAIIFLFPFIGRGLSSLFALYKGHFGEEKSTEEAAKDVGIDKDSLSDSIDKKRKEGKSDKQILEELKNERGTETAKKTNDAQFERIQSQIDELKLSLEQGQKDLQDQYSKLKDAVDEFNRDNDSSVETPPDKSGDLTPPS